VVNLNIEEQEKRRREKKALDELIGRNMRQRSAVGQGKQLVFAINEDPAAVRRQADTLAAAC
jgi:hypothetical protein